MKSIEVPPGAITGGVWEMLRPPFTVGNIMVRNDDDLTELLFGAGFQFPDFKVVRFGYCPTCGGTAPRRVEPL